MQIKLLITLVLAQTLLSIVIVQKVANFNVQGHIVESPEAAPVRSNASPIESRLESERSQFLDSEAIRQIIRQELASANAGKGTIESDAAVNDRPKSIASREAQAKRLSVQDSLAYYRSVGRISPTEMGQLQSEIAKLAPHHRREMLVEVVRAINSGELEGAF